MTLRVIVNPGARSGRARRLLGELGAEFERHGVQADVVATRAPGHARELARQATGEGVDGVIAAGGDGTLFEVVNGLADARPDRRPILGVVPLGTGNAFARDLGLAPWAWRAAIANICAGRARWVDLASVRSAGGDYHFINIVGCGFVVTAGRMAQRVKPLGAAAYQAGVVLALPRLRPFQVVLDADGVRHEREVCALTVSNSRFTGTDFLVAPGAQVDDGLLDVMLVQAVSRRRLLQVLPALKTGAHVHEPEVIQLQAVRLGLAGADGQELAPDGEFFGRLPAVIENVSAALRVFVPDGALPAFRSSDGVSSAG